MQDKNEFIRGHREENGIIEWGDIKLTKEEIDEACIPYLNRGYIDHVDIHILNSSSDDRDIKLRQFTSWECKQNKDGTYDLVLHNGVLSIDDYK